MLHLHNGDSAANIARQTSLPGEHVAWRESLITGPTPAGLSDDEWLDVRSEHLSEAYGERCRQCRTRLVEPGGNPEHVFPSTTKLSCGLSTIFSANCICFTCSIGFRSATWEELR